MRNALQEESNPHDERLDIAIPGIRQWHTETRRMISGVSTTASRIEREQQEFREEIQLQTQQILERQEYINERHTEVASQLIGISARMLTDKSSPDPTSPAAGGLPTAPSSPGLSPTTSPGVHNGGRELPIATPPSQATEYSTDPSAYNMNIRHSSLTDMWNEWFGLGPYEVKCGDIPGGIHGRNQLFGSKWRKHYSQAKYSRTQRIIKMISSMMEKTQPTPFLEEVLEEVQKIYDEVGCNVSAMVERCQEMGLITKKKPRGKKRTAATMEEDAEAETLENAEATAATSSGDETAENNN